MKSDTPIESDDELIVRAYHGDRDAFGSLYERYLKQIYRYIYFRVSDVHEAEDLTDIVFIKAWESLPGLRLENFKIQAWLYRIAHNLVIDRFRTLHPDSSIETLSRSYADGQNPEEAFDISDRTRIIARKITKLDPTLQEVLICRFILGYSHTETAEVMDRSVVYVRVLQHRALSKLREMLEGEIQENDGTNLANAS
jgi:RNA polymerase sigma-70 factor (ECF subfamily)